MEREIEFRRAHFFDEEKTKFSHFTEWGVNVGGNGSVFTSPSTNNFALYHIDEQFTGLTDKNGKKIFEGDIVAGYKCSFEVKFIGGAFMWGNELLGYSISGDYEACVDIKLDEDNDVFEVIGNIHDTK